jgi:putative ABC transport system substrate-binding protein
VGGIHLLVITGTPSTAAAKAATTTIPIVFSAAGDPVGSGFVATLGKPGGNVTGSGGLGPGVHAKMLGMLKEAVPTASQIAIFVNSTLPLHTAHRAEIEPAARTLGVTLRPVEVRVAEDLEGAFTTLSAKGSARCWFWASRRCSFSACDWPN